MNDYQTGPAAASPVSEYAKKAAEEKRRYQELKNACASPLGAGIALGGLMLGVLAVEMGLLYPAGLSMPLLLIAFEVLLIRLFRERASKDFLCLGALMALTSAGYLLHDNPSTRWICSLGLLLGCALQLASLGGGESPLSAGILASIPVRLLSEPLFNLGLPFSALGTLRSTKSRTVRTGAAILLGLVLALPVSGMLLLLFASADAVFGAALEAFFRSLPITPFAVFCDVVFGGLLGLLLASRLLAARFSSKEAPVKIPALRLPALVSGAFLSSVVSVTLLFVGFQFAYLFGGEQTRAAWELTYSDYARRGFFELCAASALVFGATLLALLFTRAGEKGTPRGVRLLAALLCMGDFVILISALCRMLLYISAYGMSIRRLLTLWGMAVVAAGLVLLLIRCFWERLRVVRALLIAGFAAICLLSLCNTERVVASWNLQRMVAGEIHPDAGSFSELSYTAAPQVEALYAAWPEGREALDEVLRQMERRFDSKHPLYSFSVDQLAAKGVFDRHSPS